MVFAGVGVALATLFDDDGEVDADATAAHAARLVDLGIAAVVVAGTTGEAAALSGDERDRLLAAVRAAVDAVPVIAGTGAPSARQAAVLTRRARDGGADAVLTLSPPQTADPRPYYDRVAAAAAADMPVVAYHFPTVAPPGIPVEVINDLPVAACKDSSGDAERLLVTLRTTSLPLYTGSSALLSLAGPAGCAGAILALANVEPERCIAAFGGDADIQRDLIDAHIAIHERFPVGLKARMAQRFGTGRTTRLG
jgi:dihydrodipicolinate synthase/N-acetylneuraminate lyase